MKAIRFGFAVVALLTGLSIISSVSAQGGNAIEFKIATSFVAGDAKFPAGTYMIKQDQGNLLEWEISNESKGISAFLPTESMSASAANQKTEVTFQKYGTTLVLKEIWIPGLATGFSIQTSYAETKAAKSGTPTKVSVAATKK